MAHMVEKAKDFLAEKVAHVKKPEADLSDVSVKHLDRSAVTFATLVGISNPYSHDLPICEVTYTFKSANRVLASGTMPDPGSIRGNDKTTLEVPLQVPYDFLMNLLKDIGRDWDIDYELNLGLVIDLPVIGNFTIPLTKRGETKLPTLRDVF